jgi:tetratricopeptide (TPR) repeat protein
MISSFSSLSKISRPDLNKYTSAYTNALKNDPDDPSLNTSLGICFLSLGLHEKALANFEKAIGFDPENSSGHYMAAICLLNGKSAFLCEKKRVDKAIEYVNAALTIEELGTYHLFMAYLKYDYYKRKFLRTEPDYRYHLDLARSIGYTSEDEADLFNILKVSAPTFD